MNLKYSLLVLAGISSLAAQAQTSQPTTIEAPAHRVAFAHEPGANYFISLAGGVGAMFLEGNNTPKLTDVSLGRQPSLSVSGTTLTTLLV